MTDFVRVRLDNGSEASVSAEFAKLNGLAAIEKKEGARNGVALPPKRSSRKSPAKADATTTKEN